MIPLCLPWAYSFPEHCPGHSIGQPDLRALPNKHRASSGTVHLPEEQQTILQPHHLPSQTEDSQRSYLEPAGWGGVQPHGASLCVARRQDIGQGESTEFERWESFTVISSWSTMVKQLLSCCIVPPYREEFCTRSCCSMVITVPEGTQTL